METFRILGVFFVIFGAFLLIITLMYINTRMRKVKGLDNETSDYLLTLMKRDKMVESILFFLLFVGLVSRMFEAVNIVYLISLFGVGIMVLLKVVHNVALNMLLFNQDSLLYNILTEFVINLNFRKGLTLLKEVLK